MTPAFTRCTSEVPTPRCSAAFQPLVRIAEKQASRQTATRDKSPISLRSHQWRLWVGRAETYGFLTKLLGDLRLFRPNLVVKQCAVFSGISNLSSNVSSRTNRVEMMHPVLLIARKRLWRNFVTMVRPNCPAFCSFHFHARDTKAAFSKIFVELQQLGLGNPFCASAGLCLGYEMFKTLVHVHSSGRMIAPGSFSSFLNGKFRLLVAITLPSSSSLTQ